LKDSNVNPKVETTEEEGIGVRSLARNTSRVEGHARALGWGLEQMRSESIIHMNLNKPNNKLKDERWTETKRIYNS
jgi:hypothetical protein